MVIGSDCDIFDTDDLSSLSVFMRDNSVEGADIYAVVYEIDASTGDEIYLFQSDDYTLTSNDLGSWVTIPFSSNESLVPGTYMAAIGGYANPVDTSIIGMSQYTYPTTCWIQKNGCLNSGQTFGNWYWLSRNPMIRMNFAIVSAIEEDVFEGNVSIFPNPTNGIFTIDMVDVNNGDYIISVRNILGEMIFSDKREINGLTSIALDLSDMDKGTYIIDITSEDSIFFEKITVQ